ncbi:alpha/beta hydrolase [Crossiella sp. SN42]|uniref:alpha/beta fold hydrolase n=1 Tax=Crossiella sp. SN42 TaxID=2944808 RepID=UPI00207C5ECA|nr:alpha/beta fold hydrolase [Crossiella sp. SN42]MCO1580303.1 alpha/beta hydrolase [Crossiella sp. SN42]
MKALFKLVVAAGLFAAGAGTATADEGPAWRECHDGLWCAEVQVPADWTSPADGSRVAIPLLKIPARDRKLGVLLVNPGGPAAVIPNFGFPGYRDQFADLAARFDVVVFDPRGMGVRCPTANPAPMPAPVTESAHREHTAANERFAVDCADAMGAYRGRLNARQVAHDLDAIRGRLGERRLNYFGSSYGTVYGQAYAALFGHRVGRMYLDSVLDHTRRDPADWARAGAVTAEHNLHRMARWCAGNAGCALHGRDVLAVWDRVLSMPAVDASAVLSWAGARIGDDRIWPTLTAGLAQAEAGDLSALTPRPGPPDFGLARTAFCADFPHQDDFATVRRLEDRLRAVAPRLGWAKTPWQVTGHCSGVPRVGLNPPAALSAMPRVLIANGEHDPLTPAEHGRRVAAQLRGTYLPTAGNHALYLRGNACVRDHVHRYLWTGALPAPDARCGAPG